ncbi:MAG: cyanophycinase [Cytophagaceae bacterium]|nr:cyanophycinase [Gemmatimonadaceae bacterium]
MPRYLIPFCALALGGSLTTTPALAQSPGARPAGTLFMVGGGPQPDSLVREFIQLAGGAGRARIVVFAMASQAGLTGGQEKAEQLNGFGARARNVYVTHDQADTDSVAALLADATGIWFGGGDQTRLADALLGTKTAAAIHARYRTGAVIGGTSAGAAIMSTPMITGDERRRGGDRYPADSDAVFITIDRDNVATARGLGLVTTAIVDQHFIRRKRENRLLSLVLEGPVRLGVGIDESTALIVEPNGRWRTTGASSVVIFDARQARLASDGHPLGGSGILTHILPPGSRFDPATGRVTLPPPVAGGRAQP